MVKAQVKGLSMQPDPTQQWYQSHTSSPENTWSTSSTSARTHSSQSPTPTVTSLKRQRSPPTMSNYPPLPKLGGDVILEVFTHRSLRFSGALLAEDSEYGDNERLAILGEKVLEAAVTDTLFRKRPMLKAEEIEHQRKEILSSKSFDDWVVFYKMRERLRCGPDFVARLTEPNETSLLFNSYVGAVYATAGMSAVQNWIGALIDPDFDGDMQVDMDTDSMYNPKKFKMDQMIPQMAPEPLGMPPPLPPMNTPPPLPNPLAPAQPSTAFLPLFNQTANQRRIFVEYPAQFSGPPHAGKWTVKCVVNGMEKGVGSGPSKQLAKEEAAKQAYIAMGWAPRG